MPVKVICIEISSTFPSGPTLMAMPAWIPPTWSCGKIRYAGPLYDVNADGRVDDADYLIWQQSYHTDIKFDDRPENLNQQGPVDDADLLILQQAYGVNAEGDVNNDGVTDGLDFLAWQQAFTPYEIADINRDRVVDERDLEYWTQSEGYTGIYDADLDGDSDGRDFLLWQRRLTPSASSATVPEPGTWLLGLIAALVYFQVACRRDSPKDA